MPFGLRVFNPNGASALDYTDRPSRGLGSVQTNAVDGSITVPAFAQGTPYAFAFAMMDSGSLGGTAGAAPAVSINTATNTLSWTYSGSIRANCMIVYGIY